MKKICWIISCLCLAFTVSAQERIERLFPLLGKCEGLEIYEFLINNENDTIPGTDFTVVLMPTETERLPAGIQDSILSAFEKELPKASESCRYQKRGNNKDSLSYSLIYAKEIIVTGRCRNIEMFTMATLDIANRKLSLTYNSEAIPDFQVYGIRGNKSIGDDLQKYDAEMLAMIFNEIAANSVVIKQPLSFDGSKNTCGYCLFQTIEFKKCRSRGIRLEVPPSLAEDAYTKMADAMNKAALTGYNYSLCQEKNAIHIFFAKDMRGEAFLMHRTEDGRVYLFHKEAQEEGYGNAIPQNWYSEDYLK